ncbi:MAG: DUF4097 family beta strand repeat protein [Gracilimonas sp.]|uniref:DUF4097 family beta strand repeat-containing protein n=1 Tax=Gracilimonas sp. TaxID=1974203 RepID=UPI0019C7D06B|nr:DUF4097 family beta strand repeat-containing protein [Gracilimonas sp.]MBD3616486.1 DUF4097 family beta strand repeat protein [Gracilimonas sp.]
MKTSSWEIIIAGFIFVGVAIYLIEQNSDAPVSNETAAADSIRINLNGNDIRVFELKSLQNLENLKNLENLENLKNLRNLENLKNLTNFLPAEVRTEFEAEIDEVMQEFEQESVNVVVNTEKGTVSVDKIVPASSGNWTAVSPGVFAYAKEFDATTLQETRLELPFGSIDVIGSSGPKAEFTVKASGQISTKADLQSKINTSTNITADRAFFKITPQTGQSKNLNIQLQATLSIPENIRVHMLTNAGHISSEDIHGEQNYKTLGGHITLKNISGKISAETGGGHISISDSEGHLVLNSKGGSIHTQNSTGRLIMKTAGGNLQAYDFGGSVDASTNGGNIELRFLKLDGNSSATTGAGTITLWTPKSENASFNLAGSSIEIDSELDFQGTTSSGSAQGTIGNGATSITAKTNYGKVILHAKN